jgi:cell division protein FtsB
VAPQWKSWLIPVVPAAIIIGLVVVSVRGEGGLLQYWELQDASAEAREEWASLERRNTELLFELRQLQADPIQMERLVAEELGYARPGTVLYRFEDADAGTAEAAGAQPPGATGIAAPANAE